MNDAMGGFNVDTDDIGTVDRDARIGFFYPQRARLRLGLPI